MTGRMGGWGTLRSSVAGAAVVAGLVFGSAGTAFAEPTPTTPTPAPSAPVAAPSTPKVLAPSTAPAPTVAVAGGAAAGAAAAAEAATAAAAATQGDVLDQLADQYAVGSGGGQLSNLLKVALKLRAMGYKPSKQYLDELQAAMAYRPNQLPLIDALKDTIAYQQKLRAQMEILSQAQSQQNAGSAVMGAGQMPAASNPANLAPQSGAQPAAGAPAAPAPIVLPTP